jgi:hypothetical protein
VGLRPGGGIGGRPGRSPIRGIRRTPPTGLSPAGGTDPSESRGDLHLDP